MCALLLLVAVVVGVGVDLDGRAFLAAFTHGAAHAGAGLELVVYLIASARATEEKTSHTHDEGVKSRVLHD